MTPTPLRKFNTLIMRDNPTLARLDFLSDEGTKSFLVNEAILREIIKGCTITLDRMKSRKH